MALHIVKRPLDKQAADVIRQLILSGGAAPGSRLKEGALSEQCGLARSTIRTALHQLAGEGLVNQIPYKGWCVFDLTGQDIWELYTLRASLEALAASLAADNVTDRVRQRLQAALEELEAACAKGDAEAISQADFRIHRTIVEATGHGRLQDQYKLVEQQICVFITSANALVSEPGAIIQQHRPIVDAVSSGRGEEAARLASAHNLTEGEKLYAHQRRLELQQSQSDESEAS